MRRIEQNRIKWNRVIESQSLNRALAGKFMWPNHPQQTKEVFVNTRKTGQQLRNKINSLTTKYQNTDTKIELQNWINKNKLYINVQARIYKICIGNRKCPRIIRD